MSFYFSWWQRLSYCWGRFPSSYTVLHHLLSSSSSFVSLFQYAIFDRICFSYPFYALVIVHHGFQKATTIILIFHRLTLRSLLQISKRIPLTRIAPKQFYKFIAIYFNDIVHSCLFDCTLYRVIRIIYYTLKPLQYDVTTSIMFVKYMLIFRLSI